MKTYLATDHAGFEIKEKLKDHLYSLGFSVEDCGAFTFDEDDDYPDFVAKAARGVSHDPENSRAIVLGGSGQGEAMVANKFPRVRAAVFYGFQGEAATLSREHNNANVLSIGARFVTAEEAKRIVGVWLATNFSNDERHKRRIEKIARIEGELYK
jgi:ribose 5-phosphate isomerase B